jgi:ATP-dependent DNA helicase RecQ
MTDQPEVILKKHWGYDQFRPGQRSIVDSILQGKDTLALLPTGGGKSICFQVPGIILPGLALVVSPLIALMKDQVDGLLKREVSAAFLNSGQSFREQKQIMENALQGHYQFLYIAPERLLSESFREYVPNLNVSCLIVDEAHCISMWGSDFRPSFRKISEIRELLPPKVPVAAFTASAPQWIQEDIVAG